jgi:glycosyltransferase involved in cell wall biosynthesis
MRHLFGSPHVVISPSQFLRDFYLLRGFFKKSRVEVLRNPLTFPRLISPQIARASDNIFRFLYVGQIESHKGVVELIQAFKKIADTDTELHIVGGGSKLSVIQNLIEGDKRINVYGRLDRRELPAIFARMNMTVVPSLCYENSPTVIFESFAAGVPVLASNIEGIAELIRQGENGLTFPAGDIDELKNKLQWCLQNQEKVKDMGSKTSKSLEGLSLGEYIEKLITLYT